MSVQCFFCEWNVIYNDRATQTSYLCPRCGQINLTEEVAEDFASNRFTVQQKRIVSIVLRNDYESRRRKPFSQELSLDDLHNISKQYRQLDPLEKMDNALLNFEKATKFVGSKITLNYENDYPYYHCVDPKEFQAILKFLRDEGFIDITDPVIPDNSLSITPNGYKKLSDLKKPGKDSRQCFVAMWFTPEMNKVYEKAVKPAIEYIEDGETTSRFEAVKIDNVEHVNDINDEIIAQLRRSRFMVCDLTGYRGGVYFEAGFAYGLGIDVIYTCRKDWTKEEILKDQNGNTVNELFDSAGNKIQVKKEGVHFDLSHRNRIEWDIDNLEDFKIKLENRIKAAIY